MYKCICHLDSLLVAACLVRNPVVDLAQKLPKGLDVPVLVPQCMETPHICLVLQHVEEANHQTHRFVHSDRTYYFHVPSIQSDAATLAPG